MNSKTTNLKDNKEQHLAETGFTLFELMISLTIISMIVLVLYYSFSLGVRIWQQGDNEENVLKRHEVFRRLLKRDFRHAARYSFRWEKGKGFFLPVDRRPSFM